MKILIAKRYSFAQGMLKPERKSPSIPTVEMISPFKKCAVHKEFTFAPLMHALGAFTIGSISTGPEASAFVSKTRAGRLAVRMLAGIPSSWDGRGAQGGGACGRLLDRSQMVWVCFQYSQSLFVLTCIGAIPPPSPQKSSFFSRMLVGMPYSQMISPKFFHVSDG